MLKPERCSSDPCVIYFRVESSNLQFQANYG